MKTFFTALLLFILGVGGSAQVVWTEPFFPSINSDVTIYYDASQGNKALNNFGGAVYAHMGVITDKSNSPSDWKYVQTTWGTADAKGLMTKVSANLYSKAININAFFKPAAGEKILQLSFVFRNQDGSIVGRATNGGDIYTPVYDPPVTSLTTRFLAPENAGSIQVTSIGNKIKFFGAASENADLVLTDNGTTLASASNASKLNFELTVSSGGLHNVVFQATKGANVSRSTFQYIIPTNPIVQDPPAGFENGLSLITDTEAHFQLYAPGKQYVYLLGDFNNWQPSADYLMRKSTNGQLWWLRVPGLQKGKTYTYQYLVDGGLSIADPFSTLVADPDHDRFIPPATYPNLPTYPTGLTSGIVSVFTPGEPAYNWQVTNFQRPSKGQLNIYELLLRDFMERPDYAVLKDTLAYFKKLGINAIELMPVQEFEGNLSWGYNPNFHMALDKYYGTRENFKKFVDACHEQGIAVIVDVVFNHAFGSSPLVRLYWNSTTNKPQAGGPYFNPDATHPFSVGYDFNHESLATQYYMDRCLKYWLTEYKVDGFRFDLSKGFTQKVNSDVGLWSALDASRVALLQRMANSIRQTDPNAILILEHLGANTEEKQLADNGFLLWGNLNYDFTEASMGFKSNLAWSTWKQRGWNGANLVAYMESHDEERMMYKNLNFGNADFPSYNVRQLPLALKRQQLASNIYYSIPGPKMIWQFGELGYDFSINHCTNGTVNPNCRLDQKPIRWDYLNDPLRKELWQTTAGLLELRRNYPVFQTSDYTYELDDVNGIPDVKWVVLRHPDGDVVSVGNFSNQLRGKNIAFPSAGVWYDYYSGDSITLTSTSWTPLLQAGEFRLFGKKKWPVPPGGYKSFVVGTHNDFNQLSFSAYPNPAKDQVTLQLPESIAGTVVVECWSMQGALLNARTLDWSPRQSIEIDLPKVSGAVWLRVKHTSGTGQVQIMITN